MNAQQAIDQFSQTSNVGFVQLGRHVFRVTSGKLALVDAVQTLQVHFEVARGPLRGRQVDMSLSLQHPNPGARWMAEATWQKLCKAAGIRAMPGEIDKLIQAMVSAHVDVRIVEESAKLVLSRFDSVLTEVDGKETDAHS